jgi:hypothetical protein
MTLELDAGLDSPPGVRRRDDFKAAPEASAPARLIPRSAVLAVDDTGDSAPFAGVAPALLFSPAPALIFSAAPAAMFFSSERKPDAG